MTGGWPTRWPQPVLWIPAIYAVLAGLWVAASDQVAAALSPDLATFERWSVWKGWGFVAVSAALLQVGLLLALRRRDALRHDLDERDRQYRSLVERSPDAILIQEGHTVVFGNEAAARLLGAETPEALIGRSVFEFTDPSEHAGVRERSARAVASEPHAKVLPRLLRRLDGTTLHAEVALAAFELPGRPVAVQITIRDTSTAWALQEELHRTNQALRLLSASVEAVERASSEAELLREVCRVAVEVAGYRLAWVGFAQDDPGRTVRRAAAFGEDGGLLQLLELSWGDSPRGQGPTGIAIRNGRAAVADLRRATGDQGLLAAARARGFAAVAAIPIHLAGRAVGVLNLHSNQGDAFDGPVVLLLQRLADDLGFGLEALRTREALEFERQGVAESRRQLRALAARLDEVREEEKSRIARDLHDELGQLLTGLQMDLRWVERRLSDLPEGEAVNAMVDRVVGAAELADQTTAAVQRIAAELRPGALDRLGLVPALRQEARRFQERTGIPCQIDLDESLPEPPPEVATALYRIGQEAMTNVSRHAQAHRVLLRLGLEAAALVLRVEDDGRGLGPAARGPMALGLLGMEERASRLGGQVRFSSWPGGGTVVIATVPIQAPARPAAPPAGGGT
jgi:PAS domain S-box-containing protein